MKRIGTNKSNIGIIGEDVALSWLISKGFIYISQNFKSFHGEIDIIVKKNDVAYFVEVKSVSISHETKNFIDPRENFSKKKFAKMLRTIDYYLMKNSSIKNFRTALVCVYINKDSKKATIKFLENPIF